MGTPPYKFNYGQPGHFVEIYLPKKAAYQGTLYDTLTKGFDLRSVREHFLDRQDDVRAFLKDHAEFCNYTKEQADQLAPSYNGYSLYELDGVFRKSPPLEPKVELCEERVQVIRLMFLPPEELLADVDVSNEDRQLASRRYVRFWTQKLSEYLSDLERCGRNGAEKEIAKRLRDWLNDVGLFLHGYILFKLCENVPSKSSEQEIWLTSFRCLAVVKTTRLTQDGVQAGETLEPPA